MTALRLVSDLVFPYKEFLAAKGAVDAYRISSPDLQIDRPSDDGSRPSGVRQRPQDEQASDDDGDVDHHGRLKLCHPRHPCSVCCTCNRSVLGLIHLTPPP
jgi:hypothetical protein